MDPVGAGTVEMRKHFVGFADSFINAINKELQNSNVNEKQERIFQKWVEFMGWFREASIMGDPTLFEILAGNNFSQFCANDPVNNIDPNGQFDVVTTIVVITTVAAVIGAGLTLKWILEKVEEVKEKGTITAESGEILLEIVVETPVKIADPCGIPVVSWPLKPLTEAVVEKYRPRYPNYNR